MTSFIYTSISLLCAMTCIISVPTFIVIFIASNFFTYFLVYIVLIESTSEFLIYVIPIHLNFLFFLVTGWVTLLSFNVVFKHLKDQKIFSVVNGEVRGDVLKMIQLTLPLSCLFSLITVLGTGEYGLYNSDRIVRNTYFRMMALLLPSFFLLGSMVGVFRAYWRNRTDDLGVRHIKCSTMFTCYHVFAWVTWLYGVAAYKLSTYPGFWQVYLIVMICLPFSFLQNVFLSTRVKFMLHLARNANAEDSSRVRTENV